MDLGDSAILCRSSQDLVMLDGGSSVGSYFQADDMIDNLKPKDPPPPFFFFFKQTPSGLLELSIPAQSGYLILISCHS